MCTQHSWDEYEHDSFRGLAMSVARSGEEQFIRVMPAAVWCRAKWSAPSLTGQ